MSLTLLNFDGQTSNTVLFQQNVVQYDKNTGFNYKNILKALKLYPENWLFQLSKRTQ